MRVRLYATALAVAESATVLDELTSSRGYGGLCRVPSTDGHWFHIRFADPPAAGAAESGSQRVSLRARVHKPEREPSVCPVRRSRRRLRLRRGLCGGRR